MNKSRFTFILLLVVAMFSTNIAFAQNGVIAPIYKPNPQGLKAEIPKGRGNTLLYIGSGYNFLNSNTQSQAYLNDAIGVNASIYQPLVVRKVFTFGIHIGAEYGFSLKNNFPALPSAFHVIGETSSTVAYNSNAGNIKQSAFKIEVGPQLNIHLGNHFVISPAFLVGGMVLSQNEITADQTTIQNNILGPQTYHYTLLRKLDMTSGALALTPKIRFHYLINNWIGLWAEVNYTIAPTIKTYLSKFTPQDTPDSTGYYDRYQLDHGTTTTEQRKFQYASIGINGGLVFSFGRKKEVRPVDFDEVHGKIEPRTGRPIDFDEVHGKKQQGRPVDFDEVLGLPDGEPGALSKPSGRVVSDAKPEVVRSEEGQQDEKKRKQQSCNPIITYPVSDASLNPKTNNHINVTFPESYSGEKSIRIYKLSEDANYLNTLKPEEKARMMGESGSISESEMKSKKSYTLSMNKAIIPLEYTTSLDNNTSSEGTYMVYAGNIGCQSKGMVYKSSSCTPISTTTLDSARCQDDGSVKVWGHISINTPTAGRAVTSITSPYIINTTDNVNAILTSLTPSPIPPADGVTHFTFIAPKEVSCKKIKVVFNINYSNCLQGTSSYPCANDTSFQMPCCLCRDCDSTTLTFNQFTETHPANRPFQYNIAGGITSNRPVYGLEFQVLSYNFTDTPSSCGNGIHSVEQSGMFLMPGTTINQKPALVYNVTTPGADPYASKDVVLRTTTPMVGSIPVNLQVGLPGPLPGMTTGCCLVTYDVCIKVKVFYDPNSCKSCTFNHCFHFSNK